MKTVRERIDELTSDMNLLRYMKVRYKMRGIIVIFMDKLKRFFAIEFREILE